MEETGCEISVVPQRPWRLRDRGDERTWQELGVEVNNVKGTPFLDTLSFLVGS